MKFLYPWAFTLFIPLAFGAWRALRHTRAPRPVFFPNASKLIHKRTWRQYAALVAPWPTILGACAAIIALARPVDESEEIHSTRDAIAIEMAIDISGSMRALDLTDPDFRDLVTRLDVVKETFSKFVEARENDMIGLVCFSGYATTRAPLTFDHAALTEILDSVTVPGDLGEPITNADQLTAIGDGLVLACARLDSATNVQSRVVVLLSDGANNYGDVTPEDAAALAARQGVKVYSIGIGSNRRAPFATPGLKPHGVEVDIFGRPQLFETELDEAALRKIAKVTGGKYWNVNDETALEQALSQIDALEKTEIDETVLTHRWELAGPWLVAAAIMATLGLVLGSACRRTPI